MGGTECEKEDCFGNSKGRCMCLTDTNFGWRDCPFFKTKKQYKEERKREEIKYVGSDCGNRGSRNYGGSSDVVFVQSRKGNSRTGNWEEK